MRALFLALALAACAPTAQTPPAGPPQNADQASAQDACGMARFRHLIGTPAEAIDQASLPPGTRIVTPTSMITEDFRADRLNIMTGTDGKVSSLRCF